MSNPLVSVIIPTYNTRPEWLRKAVRTVLDQTYTNIELIVIDDGSETPFSGVDADFSDSRIHWIRNQTNIGVSATRNKGAEISQGEYLAFLDADDWWESEKLALQVKQQEMTGAKWVYCEAKLTSQDGAVVSTLRACKQGNVYRDVLARQIISGSCSGVLLQKELFQRVGGFDDKGIVIEDWDLWIRLAKEEEVACVEIPLVYLRWYSSVRRGTNSGKIGRLEKLQEKHKDEIVKHGLRNVARAHYCSVSAKQCLRGREYLLATRYTCECIWHRKDLITALSAFGWLVRQLLHVRK